MSEKITKEQAESILAELNNAIIKGPWENSNFLRLVGKNLSAIRDDFAKQLDESIALAEQRHQKNQGKISHHQGLRKIYIGLYSSEGNNIHTWENIIYNLPRQIISRPIYANEEDARYAMLARENKLNQSYVTVFIDPSDIIVMPDDKIPKDKHGKALLTLKDRALKLENIIIFTHALGEFDYLKSRLIKKTS